jgi:hypothetical protein
MATYSGTARINNAVVQANILRNLTAQLLNDVTILLGNLATMQTNINAGTAELLDYTFGDSIQNLQGVVLNLDQQIQKLQQSTNG